MPNPISSMKVADPGVGFKADLSQLNSAGNGQPAIDTSKPLHIKVRVHDNANTNGKVHQCVMNINAPLNLNEELVIILPFDCTVFKNLSSVRIDVDFQQGSGDGIGYIDVGPDPQPYSNTISNLHKTQKFKISLGPKASFPA